MIQKIKARWKVKQQRKQDKQNYPKWIFDELYAADKEVDHVINYIIDHGVLHDIDDHHFIFKVPNDLIVVWRSTNAYASNASSNTSVYDTTAKSDMMGLYGRLMGSNDAVHGGHYDRGKKRYSGTRMWNQAMPSFEMRKKLYDFVEFQLPHTKQASYETYEKSGIYVKTKRIGDEFRYYIGSQEVAEAAWAKEFALWLLTNK